MTQLKRKKGQALVEFALSALLIFFLLAAAVDLGMMFFTVQGLNNAAQEGASYGSRWLTGNIGARQLNVDEIQERVRFESGDSGGIGFINLLDLNNDGTPDDAAVVDEYIKVESLADTDFDGNPVPDATPCESITGNLANTGGVMCYIKVTVYADYDLVFPLAPAFGDSIKLQSSHIMIMR